MVYFVAISGFFLLYFALHKNVQQYFDSFKIAAFIYPEVKLRTDTAMHFTVQSPIYPDEKKQQDLMESIKNIIGAYGVEDESDMPEFGVKTIGSDTTGEKTLECG